MLIPLVIIFCIWHLDTYVKHSDWLGSSLTREKVKTPSGMRQMNSSEDCRVFLVVGTWGVLTLETAEALSPLFHMLVLAGSQSSWCN